MTSMSEPSSCALVRSAWPNAPGPICRTCSLGLDAVVEEDLGEGRVLGALAHPGEHMHLFGAAQAAQGREHRFGCPRVVPPGNGNALAERRHPAGRDHEHRALGPEQSGLECPTCRLLVAAAWSRDHDEVGAATFRAENGISKAFDRGPSSREGRLLGSVHPAVVDGLELRNPPLLLLRQGVQQAAGQVGLGGERGVPRWCTDGEDIDASATREHSETLGRMQQVGSGLGALEHDQDHIRHGRLHPTFAGSIARACYSLTETVASEAGGNPAVRDPAVNTSLVMTCLL